MKKHFSKRLLSLLLAVVLCVSMAVPAGAADASDNSRTIRFEKVDNSAVSTSLPTDRLVDQKNATPQYSATDKVRVSIVLEGKSTIEKGFLLDHIATNSRAMSYRQNLQTSQDAMAAKISGEALKGQTLDVVWNLTLAANLISANVLYGDIDAIKAVKGVKDVFVETRYEPDTIGTETTDPNMATSGEMIGSNAAWSAGYTGKGSIIAVIDTGTDTDHQSFDADAFLYAVGEDAELMDATDIASVVDQLNVQIDPRTAYLSAKLPFAYNYVDGDYEVTHDNDEQGEHGSHVAGIATANRYISNGDGTYSDALTTVHTQGVAPDAQLITMKVFGKNGGAYDSDYMAAIEDAIVLGADSINLSLGSGNPGFSSVSTAAYQDIMDNLTEAGAVICISAGNSGTWQEETTYGYLYNDGVSMQTNGSPGSYTNAFTVGSVDNTGITRKFLMLGETPVSYSETTGYTNALIETLDTSEDGAGTEYDFILFENTGKDGSGNNLLTDYADLTAGKIVLVYRGTSSFYEKHDAVAEVGGAACIVVNNQAGEINMDLSSSTATIPCVSITQVDGETIKAAATPVTDEGGNTLYYTGKITVSNAIQSVQGSMDSYTISSFSSWGVPGSLELKPEITAPGGNIYSVNGAVAGGKAYENMSGTSMAAPQVTGMVALIAQYIRENDLTTKTGLSARQLAQSLLMSTATPIDEEDSGSYYSLLAQGAGLANVGDALNAHSVIMMGDGANAGAADGKVKVELGEDPAKTGTYSFHYTLTNLKDEDAEYHFDTDVFTQDVFKMETYTGVDPFLDTWTTPLDAIVTYEVGGVQLFSDRAQKILDYVAGEGELTDDETAAYDVDGDGSITSYDAHLALISDLSIVLPANESVTVNVTIALTDETKEYLNTYYPVGAYIEAFSYAEEVSSAEGEKGTRHSIPVLGFYGNWSDASMYDVGTLAEYWYETEERYPYLVNETDAFTNYLTVKYAGVSGEYYYFGNPLTDDDEYLEERNAFNSNDLLAKYYATIIRNAGGAIWQVTDAETGEVYARKELGAAYSAYYYANGQAWRNTQSSVALNWNGTDANGDKLPEGTEVLVSLILAPEYYASEDGTYDWDALTDGNEANGELGDGAFMTTRTAIDNTAPELATVTYDAESNALSVTAADNRYLACVALYQNGVEKERAFSVPNQALEEMGEAFESVLDLSEYTEEQLDEGIEFYLQLTDYAMNQTTYKFVLKTAPVIDNTKVPPTSITLPETLTLAKRTTAQLTPTFEPWLAIETVTWSSADESIATVDENGVVTGIEEGTTTITATSTADYPEGETPASATCTVTVKAFDVTLNGMLQDEDGNPQLFAWNLKTDSTWSKTADLENDINAATFDFAHEDGKVFQMDTDGYLYKVDPTTGETLETSAAAAEFGAPVDDMEYAGLSSLNMEQDVLVGVYSGYFLYSIPGMDNTFSSGWNMASYLGTYLGASSFTAVAWAGYDNQGRDVFFCLTDSGDFWVMMPNFANGSAGLNFYNTDLDLDFPGYDGAYYCSMVMGEDGNFYLSYFNGDTNQIYVLEGEDVYEDGEYADTVYHATFLGDVGDGVWPCALLTVTSNETEDSGATDGDNSGETNVQRIITRECTELATANAETIQRPQPAANGSLNAIRVNAAPKATLNKEPVAEANGTTVTETGSIRLDIEADASTNGLLQIEYDEDVLTLFDATTQKVMSAFHPESGKLTMAYAAASEVSDVIASLIFSYDLATCPDTTTVKLTVLQDGVDFEPAEPVELTLTLKKAEHPDPVDPTPVDPTPVDPTPVDPTPVRPSEPIPVDPVPPVTPDEPTATNPFDDIDGHMFYDDILYVYRNGLMNGTGDNHFSPDLAMTRGMLVTILYRMEGEPEVESAISFPDVEDGHFYTKAVAWAASNHIVNGCDDGTFQPKLEITREQLVTILYRYAQYKGCDVSTTETLADFTDADTIAPYASEAFCWAVDAGIINGTGNNQLSPKGTATRGQLAAIIHRYCSWMD